MRDDANTEQTRLLDSLIKSYTREVKNYIHLKTEDQKAIALKALNDVHNRIIAQLN